ncbi:MAG: hypothetical protein PVI97_00635 [Candidatus Thiodiazotropha sp.]
MGTREPLGSWRARLAPARRTGAVPAANGSVAMSATSSAPSAISPGVAVPVAVLYIIRPAGCPMPSGNRESCSAPPIEVRAPCSGLSPRASAGGRYPPGTKKPGAGIALAAA